MPFKSQAQRRKFYAMEARGEISKSTLDRWEDHTPKDKKLPERVKSAAFEEELQKIAGLAGLVASQLARREVMPPVEQAIRDLENKAMERWQRFTTPEVDRLYIAKQAFLTGLAQRAKSVITGAPARLGTFVKNAPGALSPSTLSGAPADKLFRQYHDAALKLPIVEKYAPIGQESSAVVHDYLADVLRGRKPVIDVRDLPARTAKRKELLRHLQEGSKRIGLERQKTRDARLVLSGSVAAPAFVAGSMQKDASDDNDIRTSLPMVAGATIGAAPLVQGLTSGALGPATSGKKFRDVDQVRRAMRPGDILLTSTPGLGKDTIFKPIISALGGDPYGYHVESVTSAPKDINRPISEVHSTPGMAKKRDFAESGGAVGLKTHLSDEEDIIIKRFKNPAHAQQYVKNLNSRRIAEDKLEKLLGQRSRSSMYDKGQSVRAAAKSFLPGWMQKLVSSSAPSSAGSAVCSSLPGQASPVCLAPGVAGRDILPHHIRRSPALQTIGSFRAPRTAGQQAVERVMQVAPWLTRAGIGAGLGYGVYRVAKALTD